MFKSSRVQYQWNTKNQKVPTIHFWNDSFDKRNRGSTNSLKTQPTQSYTPKISLITDRGCLKKV